MDKTIFTSTDTQTLTVTFTPRDEGITSLLFVTGPVDDEYVTSVVTLPEPDPENGIELGHDGILLTITNDHVQKLSLIVKNEYEFD